MILLSILIPTIPERNERFTKLYNELMRQKTAFETFHDSLGRVEILVNADKRFLDGGLSIGNKRNALVKSAEGKYLCFLDDDESIPGNYLESLMRLCYQGQDVCTFQALAKLQTFWALVDMRLAYKLNDQLNPNYTARRPPWHCCPVKSVFAKMFEFPDLNNAEDFVWMEKVLACCTTEAHTEAILYGYNHGEHSEADKIPLP
jgi:glycosyltransferase involved in cell wall biosynthesis